MVKSLHFLGHGIKWLLILMLGIFAAVSLWLQTGERSLDFVKPWVVSAINTQDAPYTISIDKLSIDWRTLSAFGNLHISGVALTGRGGETFLQLPHLYATVDPLGFMPQRRVFDKVMLNNPRMSLARNAAGTIDVGLEGATERMPITDIIGYLSSGTEAQPTTKGSGLPFHTLMINKATLSFSDEKSGTLIESQNSNFTLTRKRGAYGIELAMPFTVDAIPVMVSASMRTVPGTREHVVVLKTKQLPSRLLCIFDACAEGIEVEGALDGYVAIGLAENFKPAVFHAGLSTNRAKVTAIEYFAEPLKLGASAIKFSGDLAAQSYTLDQAKLTLEDTTITAQAQLKDTPEGWFVTADASCTQLDIKKLYKYWPLSMAPDSRTWVTKKLKSGYAASGKLRLNLTPKDLAADAVSDEAVDAVVDAREITFDYLPGFPLAEKMNGIAHFTGTTVKVEGGGATLMSGTKINKAVLWCPKLDSHHNPMEATLELVAPARDVATMLALKHFPFDDAFGLDAQSIQGTAEASMKLKFNAFSHRPNEDPNAIHLDAVDYDIRTKMTEVAQKKIFGSYDISALNGTLTANNKGIDYQGSLQLGDSGISDVKLAQDYGKPMNVTVKSRARADGVAGNDFVLTYRGGEVPQISISGASVDASASYGTAENSLLADFPAMKLDLDVGELILAENAGLGQVKGSIYCTKERCESANINARAGNSELRASITQINGKRQFSMSSNNAGAMLKSIDITDRMRDGKFTMSGTYNDTKSPPQLNARLLITDFTLQNSQILGRIFSIGSLTGLQNALTGSGIAFEKMAANLASQGGVIRVDKGVANGASMGITFAGAVDTSSTTLDIKGVIAPAYALNSILGNIPIIGTLAGGDEGLIAFDYSVKGSYADPGVSVNPLSGLTPGFLRGVFSGIGNDSGAKPETPNPKKDRQPVGEKYKNDAVKSH